MRCGSTTSNYEGDAASVRRAVWLDNGYGVIRWKQQMQFGRTSGVEFGNPDFVALAQSFGAVGYRVRDRLNWGQC